MVDTSQPEEEEESIEIEVSVPDDSEEETRRHVEVLNQQCTPHTVGASGPIKGLRVYSVMSGVDSLMCDLCGDRMTLGDRYVTFFAQDAAALGDDAMSRYYLHPKCVVPFVSIDGLRHLTKDIWKAVIDHQTRAAEGWMEDTISELCYDLSEADANADAEEPEFSSSS